MLTVETLTQNTVLAGLTDAQLSAIAEMSKNDENIVIGTRIGELHGQYDADILGLTGIVKNAGEKSYDYAKRVISDYKAKVEASKAVKTELEASKAKVAELQAQIEKGEGNEALAKQLKDTKAQVAQLQSQLTAKDKELTDKVAEHDEALKSTHVDYAFQAATAGLKFKEGFTEPIQKTLLGAAKAEVLAKGTPDFVGDGMGGKKLVFRGADGNILNNPKNNLNPYTFQELIMETSLKDVIDEGRKQLGGGTGPTGTPPKGGGSVLDLSGAKTQLEANAAIERHLLANGLTRDSKEFSEQSLRLFQENNVAEMSIR